MKKIVCLCLMLGLVTSVVYAMPSRVLPYGVGAKYAAMGGAGSALVDDMAAAYYNPAGMAKAQVIAVKVGAGIASEGSDKLITMLTGISNPAKFLANNFSSAINMKGNANAIVGLDLFKMGITVIPVSQMTLVKPVNSLGGSLSGALNSDSAFTFGFGAGLPFVGNVNLGANIKYIYNVTASVAVAASALTTDLTNTVVTNSGMGYDLGAQAKVTAIPTLPLSVALVYKDFGANLNGHTKVDKATYSNLDGSKVAGSDTTISDADTAGIAVPTTFVIGAATQVPIIGAKVAVDLDTVSATAGSYSVMHIGVEYPVFMGLFALRAGMISGGPAANPISMTTYGAGILGSMINVAMVSDANNAKDNQTIFDVHLGF